VVPGEQLEEGQSIDAPGGEQTLRQDRLVPAMAVLLVTLCVGAGCATKGTPPLVPAPPLEDASQKEALVAQELRQDLESSRAELERLRVESAQLRQQLRSAQQESASAEEQYEATRREMERALDEVLASKASVRGVNNRALAISRIAEVRVQWQSAGRHDSPEVEARLRRAEALLARADETLEQGNFGGAAYLADRAGELVEHARAVAEVGSPPTGDATGLIPIIPIVPPRPVEVIVGANLRNGPDTAHLRVGAAAPGTRLVAVARRGDWFEVETEGGRTAWIHRTTVR